MLMAWALANNMMLELLSRNGTGRNWNAAWRKSRPITSTPADNHRLKAKVRRLTERLAQYEPEIRHETTLPESEPARPSSYSLESESKRRQRRQRRRKKKSPGRRPTELKFSNAHRHDNIYPDGVRHGDCHLAQERTVWRLENGRAVLVGYRLFASPDGKEPRIAGVTPRCEYGIEVLVTLAFLVYMIGISLGKACLVLGFFCKLPLSRSQADALLGQLAQHWDGEFDLLCGVIAHAAVVYMDETGWKIGTEGCSLWAFASSCSGCFSSAVARTTPRWTRYCRTRCLTVSV